MPPKRWHVSSSNVELNRQTLRHKLAYTLSTPHQIFTQGYNNSSLTSSSLFLVVSLTSSMETGVGSKGGMDSSSLLVSGVVS